MRTHYRFLYSLFAKNANISLRVYFSQLLLVSSLVYQIFLRLYRSYLHSSDDENPNENLRLRYFAYSPYNSVKIPLFDLCCEPKYPVDL